MLSKWYVKLFLLGYGSNEIAIILSGTTTASLLSLLKINTENADSSWRFNS